MKKSQGNAVKSFQTEAILWSHLLFSAVWFTLHQRMSACQVQQALTHSLEWEMADLQLHFNSTVTCNGVGMVAEFGCIRLSAVSTGLN